MWSRRAIMATSFLGSGVNVLLPFALAYFVDVRYTALWLSMRAGAQLILAVFPNPLSVILYVSKYSRIDRRRIIFGGYLWGVIPAAILCFMVFYFSGEVVEVREQWGVIAFYLVVLQVSGYESIIARGIKRSDYLLRVSLFDLVFSLLMLLVLFVFEGFGSFLFAAALKEAGKAIYFMWLRRCDVVGGISSSVERLRKITSRYMMVHMARGGLQVFSQHGDRILFPLFFGLNTAGKISLGASLAMVIAVFSSSAFAWSMPKTLEGEDMSGWIFREWSRLLGLALLVSVIIYLVSSCLDDFLLFLGLSSLGLDSIFVLGFLFSSVSSLNFMSMGVSRERLKSKGYFGVHFSWLIITYLSMYLVGEFGGGDAAFCLAVGVVVSSTLFFIVNYSFFAWWKIISFEVILFLVAFAFGWD